jgi:phosphoesterase family protein/IPT/TIG domain-containing protein
VAAPERKSLKYEIGGGHGGPPLQVVSIFFTLSSPRGKALNTNKSLAEQARIARTVRRSRTRSLSSIAFAIVLMTQVATSNTKPPTRAPSIGQTNKIAGTSGTMSHVAVVNFTSVASQEKPARPQRPAAIEEPIEPDEVELPRPVPAGAYAPSDAGRTTAPSPSVSSPGLLSSFQALNDDNSYIPPDTNGAVGTNYLMVCLNSQVRIQTRTGSTVSTVSLPSFWSAFGHTNVFDPRIVYDQVAGRWIFSTLTDYRLSSSSLQIGVSQTSDPRGNWNLYDIDIDAANLIFADYPNIGLNKDWIVVTTNTYQVSDKSFAASRFYVFNKSSLYAGGADSFTLIMDTTGNSPTPAITYDNTVATIYVLQNWNGNSGGSGSLRLSTITGPIGSETLTTGVAFPSTPNPWDSGPPGGADFAPQLGSSQLINDGDSDVQNVVYRNGSLWCVQTVFLPAGGSATRSAIQWWQLSTSGSIQQRGRIDDPSGATFYSFPSIAVNKNSDVLVGYSRFSSAQYAGASYSFRAASDPANTLRNPATLKDGEASYFKTNGGSRNKWGDFSNTLTDPADDTDFWTIQEYAAAPSAGIDRWATWWGQVAPASASPPPPPDVVLYAAEAPVRVGNWQVVADSSAAGGNRIWNPDQGASKIVTAAASPADYFEMSFTAQAATGYRLWLRGKAQNDSPYNDSVFFQFSDSTDASGSAVDRIGTTSAEVINLEDCLGCGLSGWGWQDNGWGVGVFGPLIYFQTTGVHTLRVQVREDGLSIDQIVLSASTYLNSSPGALKNDATILPRSSALSVGTIAPNSGSTTGGTSVTISGTGFVAGATVTIGGTAASGVTVVSGTSISAITPAHAAGSADVKVTNPDGQSSTLANAFTFVSAASVPAIGHVFTVILENHSYANVIGSSSMPYLNSLAQRFALATNYYANAHPSIGNYFMLTTGQLITSDDNFAGTVTADNVVRQLVSAGKTWKSYAESLPSVGYAGADQYPYVKRHNPFAYISDVINSPTQVNNLVPFSQFATDLSSNQLPNYSLIIPNQYDNAHDCPASNPSCTDADKLQSADNWLSANIAPLLGSTVFQQDGLLVIVFDESIDSDTANGGGHIATLIISPRAKPGYQSTSFYQHQSVLRLMMQALGVTSFPGAASSAPDMTEFFDTSSAPAPVINSITPASGLTGGGTSVTISGANFTPGPAVFFGGLPATNVNVVSGTTLTAVTPAHAAGAVAVTVTNTNGRSGTLANGFTYSTSTETLILVDDFNDGVIDQSKWTVANLFSGFSDSAVSVSESQQRLQIGPLKQNATGSHYNGLTSVNRYNFTGAYCQIQLVQPGASNTSADAMLTLGNDVNSYYRIYVEAGSLIVQKRINGTKSTLLSLAYDAVNHQYIRIRHDSAAGRAVFETAPASGGAPGSWTSRFSEPWSTSVSLSSILFEFKAGTWQSEANAPGTIVFDNFKAAKP